jgi:hypothetical protein
MRIRNASDLDAHDRLPVCKRRRAYELMSSDDRKRLGELYAFLGFVEASGLPINRPTVFCLGPPCPDIGCELNSSPYFFELGEVADRELARRYSKSLKTGEITGGFHSQAEPLASILASKAQKSYLTHGAPVDLLLYYWKQAPFDPEIQKVLAQSGPAIAKMLSAGSFARIWVYDHPGRVLCCFSRDPSASPAHRSVGRSQMGSAVGALEARH